MNRNEFQELLEYHAKLFPNAAEKLAGMPNWDDTKSAWFDRVFQVIEFEFAKTVSDDLFESRLAHPAQYELDRLPGIFAAQWRLHCNARASQRQDWQDEYGYDRQTVSPEAAAEMYAEIQKCIQDAKIAQRAEFVMQGGKGKFEPDVAAAIESGTAAFRARHKDDPDDFRSRVKCPLCLDSGLLLIWSAETAKACVAAVEDPWSILWTESGIACECNPHHDANNPTFMTNRYASWSTKVGSKVTTDERARYDPKIHVPSSFPDSKEKLVLWAHGICDARESAQTERLEAEAPR